MMQRLCESLQDKSGFVVVAELTGSRSFGFGPIEGFLRDYKTAGSAAIPAGFDFVGITSPQNPGGVAAVEPLDVLSHLKSNDLLGELDFVPHISGKDQNANVMVSSLVAFRRMGIENILVLTGDKPIRAKGVFELDSIGLLQMLRDMNSESYIKVTPDKLGSVHQFFAGAAVSQFKYTEASQMQQYYKMEKKIAAGARFFVTQVGWDWRKSVELFRYLDDNGIDVPIIGNVYFLSTQTEAPRLMHDLKLPGCFVSDEFLAKLRSESTDEHIERAAQQVAMYKAIGAAGVDIGGFDKFETFAAILSRASEIGTAWEQYKDNLYWPAQNVFYLYSEPAGAGGKSQNAGPAEPTKYRQKFKQRMFNLMHGTLFNTESLPGKAFKGTLAVLGLGKGKGCLYKFFDASERFFKYLIFDCEGCGDCYLPENFGLCTIGGCEKGMDSAPCGDATVEGYCGNNIERVCIGELIYEAAAAEKGGLGRLRATINKPRNPALENTSSILNYLFGRDHAMKNPLICIGESVHASIPKTGKIMQQLAQLGAEAYSRDSGELNYIKALIESQVSEGADYIAVNIDAFGESDPQITVDMMVEYVRLVRKWGGGVPICIDSSNDEVLKAGLKEWYNTAETVRQPLINSVKVYTMDNMLPLKKDYDYSFIGLLVSEEKASGPGGSHSVDELYELAKRIFDTATRQYGFRPAEIFFDSTVFPLAIDMPMEADVPGYTYRAFETIKRIKGGRKMAGAHCSLGVSNCVRDLPGRRIGVCRAYVAKAMEYGLDAGIVNVAHHYGTVEPAEDLMELVDAYAKLDGSAERLNKAMMLIGKFCQENRKPAKNN